MSSLYFVVTYLTNYFVKNNSTLMNADTIISLSFFTFTSFHSIDSIVLDYIHSMDGVKAFRSTFVNGKLQTLQPLRRCRAALPS